MSFRTKVLLWLTILPFLFLIGGLAWASIYTHLLTERNDATYFIVFHAHWRTVILGSAAIFVCALISLSYDRRNVGRK
jgi:ABC-type Fe3+ transport system permease subunit